MQLIQGEEPWQDYHWCPRVCLSATGVRAIKQVCPGALRVCMKAVAVDAMLGFTTSRREKQ